MSRWLSVAVKQADAELWWITLPLFVSSWAVFASNTSRLVLLPFRAQELGASRLVVGLLFSVITFSAALTALPAGYLTDRIGRAPVLITAVCLSTASQFVLAFTDSISVIFACQVFGGIAASASTSTLMAMLVDRVPADRLGWAMGWMTLSNQTGYLTGPAIAGLALSSLSLSTDLAFTGCLALIALPTGIGALSSARPPRTSTPSRLLSSVRDLLRKREIQSVGLAMLAATLLWGTIESYLPLFATESLAMPVSYVGYVFACQAFVNGTSRLFGGWIADWRSDLRWLITLCGTCGYALAIAVGVNLPGWLPIPCLIAGVALVATSFVSLGARFGEIATGSTRGLTMGFYSFTIYLGLAAGPILFGPVMQSAGFVTGFVVCALVASCLACAAELLGRRSR